MNEVQTKQLIDTLNKIENHLAELNYKTEKVNISLSNIETQLRILTNRVEDVEKAIYIHG